LPRDNQGETPRIQIVALHSVEDFAITVLTPSAPTIVWSIREYYWHRDAAEANEIIKAEAEAEAFWDRAASGAFLEDACALRSRELQDAIYIHRSSNPLLFPFILTGLRTSMLGRLNHRHR
jgi:SMODS-associating 4TM effector domain